MHFTAESKEQDIQWHMPNLHWIHYFNIVKIHDIVKKRPFYFLCLVWIPDIVAIDFKNQYQLCVFQMIFENIKKENLVAALNYIDIHHIIAWGLRFDKRCSTSCKKLIHVIYLGIQVSPSFHTIMKQAVWSEYASMTAKSIVIYVIEARLLLPLCNTWFTSPFL